MHKKILILIMLLLFICSCKEKKEVTREELHKKEGIPVEVVMVKKGDILITVMASGELKADDDITVSTNNKGTIEKVSVKEGQYLTAGQLIAVIDPVDLQDQTSQAQSALNSAVSRLSQAQSNAILLDDQVEASIKQAEAGVKGAEAQYIQAQAALKAAKENLSLVEEGARNQEIARAEQALIQAKANLEQLEIDLGRAKRLYDEGAISKQNLEVAQLKYNVALAEYRSVEEQVDLVKEGARTQEKEGAKLKVEMALDTARAGLEQAKELLNIQKSKRTQVKVAYEAVEVARADMEQAKANLAIVKRNLQKSFVKAPFAGYVTKLYVKEGEYTNNPGTTSLIDMFNPSTLYFEGIVSEKDIQNITKGLTVTIKIDGVTGKTFSGYIKDIIPLASESRQFTVKITLNETKTDLKPGMFARGEILLASHKDIPVIPDKCIKTQDDKTYVFIVKDLKAVRKDIVKGPSMNNRSEIMEGLKEGDKVISSGFVKDGDALQVVNEE